MQIFWNILLLAVGFVMLVKGADWFVDGAAGIAGKLKVPELVVGLTVVAFGTSAPELSVSIASALQGSSSLTVGNVIGSNIANILLILGLTALFCDIPVEKNSLKVDLPFLLFTTLLFTVLGGVGYSLGRIDGIVLFALLIGYIVFLVVQALKERKRALSLGEAIDKEEEEEPKGKIGRWYAAMCEKVWFLILLLAVGLALVVKGSDFVVDSASFLAGALGVEERIIGLTIVAIGTSLPELVTSVAAARKGKTALAVGNIIGSNIFNLLCVAGFTAILIPIDFSRSFIIDSVIAFCAAALLAILSYCKGNKIRRWGGVLLLCGFIAYYAYLFVGAFAR